MIPTWQEEEFVNQTFFEIDTDIEIHKILT